jgi:hypothetical protein
MGQSTLRRLRFAACGADLFADPVAGFVYPKIEELEVTAAIKEYERKFLSSDHDHFPHALGEKESEIKFGTEGVGFGGSPAGAGDGVAAGEGENGLLLKSVFGTQVLQSGDLVLTGTTSAIVRATESWAVGTFLGIVDPATGLFHVRQIREKTGVGPYDYTLDRALPIDPVDGSVLYGSATYYHAISGHQHMWFDAEGYDATPANGWRRYIRGCLGNLTLKNLSAAGKLALEWAFKGVDWSDAGQGSSQGAPTYPTNMPTAGAFIRNTRLWIGATERIVSEFVYDLGNEIQPKPSTSAANGVASFAITGAKQGFGFKIAEADAETATLRALWKAGSTLDVLVELTQGGPGNSFAIAAPKVQITGYKPIVVNGIDYRDVECEIKRSELTGVPAASLGVL